MSHPIPCVSLVFRNNEDKFLVGKRISNFDNGLYCPPGGKIEKYESIMDACIRECLEETGIQIINADFLNHVERISIEDKKHYIIFFYFIESFKGKPLNLEPHKCESWEWLKIEDMEPIAPGWKKSLERISMLMRVSRKIK